MSTSLIATKDTSLAARIAGVRPPRPGPLVDGEQRRIHYLRLSVTDRCNFRCRYCMPDGGVAFQPRSEILTFGEIVRLVRAFASLGIRRVRLTGGEPLLRRDLPELVRMIAAVEGIEDLALSTNAFLLDRAMADALRDAGITRVNISIDTLQPDRFRTLTRTGTLDRVLQGIDHALAAGLTPVKLNAVVIRDFNDDELSELLMFARDRGCLLRFVEYMPIGLDGFWSDRAFVPTADMAARLAEDWILGPSDGFAAEAGIVGGGPARYGLATPRGGGAPAKVGFISALTHNFCASCNRVRLTATGKLQECLAYPGELSLRDTMRAGATDDELIACVRRALFGKGAGHAFNPMGGGVRTFQAMSVTGG